MTVYEFCDSCDHSFFVDVHNENSFYDESIYEGSSSKLMHSPEYKKIREAEINRWGMYDDGEEGIYIDISL